MPFSAYDMECIANAKKLIDADISRHFTIDYIAAKSGIGKTKLKKGFKESFGLGLFTYLRKERMIRAAELLAQTDKPIKTIARSTGFRHTTNFITAFHVYHGRTPASYRKHAKS